MKYAVFFLSLLSCSVALTQWSGGPVLFQVKAVAELGVWARAVALGWASVLARTWLALRSVCRDALRWKNGAMGVPLVPHVRVPC